MTSLLNTIRPTTGASRFVFKDVETLAADRTITGAELEDYQGFSFDPGGAGRNVDLPAEAASKGCMITISNEADAAEILTVRNDAAATVATPTQNEAVLLWCDGTTWFAIVGASA